MKMVEFANMMNQNVCELEFTKLDGAIRNMIATRRSDKIPTEHIPKNAVEEDPVDLETKTSLAVFDLQVCGWRSVRPASINSIKVVE